MVSADRGQGSLIVAVTFMVVLAVLVLSFYKAATLPLVTARTTVGEGVTGRSGWCARRRKRLVDDTVSRVG